MKDLVSSHVHSSWDLIFDPIRGAIESISSQLDLHETTPSLDRVFRAFQGDLSNVKCIIIGQDPYPTPGMATGLAFSVDPSEKRIPPSLQNIFIELESDQGITPPRNGDLTLWGDAGVLLLNRILTTRIGQSNAHKNLGWQRITNHIANELGQRDVVAILWGNQAQELSKYFPLRIEGVHPSPLSAYRGFFGSRPFSKANELLIRSGRSPIDWSL